MPPDPITGSEVLRGVGKFVQGVAPSFFNNLFGHIQQNQQNAFNERMIREQNSYNSPLATKNRMIAAGITPKAAEIALSGSPSVGAQSSVATASPWQGGLPGTDLMQGISSVFANDLVDSETRNQLADIRIKNATAEGLEIDNSNKQRGYDDTHEKDQQLISLQRQQQKNLVTQDELNQGLKILQAFDTEKAAIDLKFYETRLYHETRKLALDADMTYQDLLFALYTFEDRADLIHQQGINLSTEQQKMIADLQEIQQTLDKNEPDVDKQRHIAEMRKKHPRLFKFIDNYHGVKNAVLGRSSDGSKPGGKGNVGSLIGAIGKFVK